MLLPSEIALNTTDLDERALLKMWLALKLPMEVTVRNDSVWFPMQDDWYKAYLHFLTRKRFTSPDLVFRLKP